VTKAARLPFAFQGLVFVASTALAPAARGGPDDTREVAARVAAQWRSAGARAAAMPARFVFDDETMLVPVPARSAGEPGEPGECTTLALVGARGLSFHARLSDVSFDPLTAPEPGARASSLAGVLSLWRCGADRAVRHVVVTSDAGRGTIEMVVARSTAPLPGLASIIPERTGGALPPVPEAGSLPPLSTPEKRAEAAETRARREGATLQRRATIRAGEDGNGDEEIELEAGCHRIEIFARDPRTDRPGRRFRLDIDAELRDPGDDRVLARDRTEAPDARLEACVGETKRVNLAYVGAPPRGEVLVALASWPLPARLPPMWGPVARSKMARVMFSRHVAVPADDPIFLGQGGSGTTPFPLSVEVGGCYVAVAGLTHGHARALQLRALVGARESTDERGAAEEAALTAFCIHADETARLEVHARGAAVGFGLAVFRVKSGIWEAGR
jgi:hypothetical protein